MLVSLVVLISIALALFGIWAQTAVREHQRQAGHLLRLQATRLAEAGVQRALAQRAADPSYAGEVWAVSAENLGGVHPAEVRIRVVPAAGVGTARYEATAEYPAGAIRRAQVTKRIEVPNPTARDES